MSLKYVTSGSRSEAMWLYFFGGLGCVVGIIGPMILTSGLVKTFLYPRTNLVLFFAGAISLIINSILSILDANTIWKSERAVRFDPDCIYIIQHFRKIKIHPIDIREVIFVRLPIGKIGRSRMTIKTDKSETKLLIEDTPSIVAAFQKLHVTTRVVAMPLIA